MYIPTIRCSYVKEHININNVTCLYIYIIINHLYEIHILPTNGNKLLISTKKRLYIESRYT